MSAQMRIAMQEAGIIPARLQQHTPARKPKAHRVAQVFTTIKPFASTVGKVTHYRESTIATCRQLGQLDFGLVQGVGRFRSSIPSTRKV